MQDLFPMTDRFGPNWNFTKPIKGYHCWEFQLGPLIIQWRHDTTPVEQKGLIWCWLLKT